MDQKDLKATAGSVGYQVGAAIRGERVLAQFRKIHRVTVVHGTSTHNIQQTKLEGSVLCVVERPLNYIRDVVDKKQP